MSAILQSALAFLWLEVLPMEPAAHDDCPPLRGAAGEDDMRQQLFAAIRRGKVKPGMASEFAKRVEAGAVPVMQKMDGFRGYYLIAGGDDTIVAISLFTNQAVAQTSTQTLMPWIKENLGPLLASPTEPTDGTVLIAVQP
jgi:hypothetical protein